MKLPLMHEPGCGGVAFWYEASQLYSGAPMLSGYAQTAEGEPIIPATLMCCTSCGKPLQAQPVVGA